MFLLRIFDTWFDFKCGSFYEDFYLIFILSGVLFATICFLF